MKVSERNIKINRKDSHEPLLFHDGDLPYFSFPVLDERGIRNGFTTKFGGVSEGHRAELSMSCKDQRTEICQENYRRVLKTLCMNEKRPVLSFQTHTVNILVAKENDVGKGPYKSRDYADVDGLITDLPDTPLVTLHADCVPLYFYDPVHPAIGLSHAGWKGTLNRIGEKTIIKMAETYGTSAEDLIVCIGPSICGDCYEVGSELYEAFSEKLTAICDVDSLFRKTAPDRFLLDLWQANKDVLKHTGVKEENIHVTDICTKCNPELLFSHRAHGTNRGLMAALISL